ncbi:hypothetical protein [Flavobacterium sp. JAS]|uniref:hypothetical protein n=1 Tax=Flavobacterium sp. JAS TaxID=2897329 RepID=UPI001E54BE52|nr:hypothetical protein [Flavobacterium sp. JAS]MCD0472503.1 hypothetical protein [Flavobacterium sp. JAS]
MSLNFIKIQIESQKKCIGNYIKHNAIRYCKDTIKSGELDRFHIKEVQKLLLKIEAVEDPWNWNGIPKSKESLDVIRLLEELEQIII